MSRMVRNILKVLLLVPSLLEGNEEEFLNYNGIDILSYEIMVQANGRDVQLASVKSPSPGDYMMVARTMARTGIWKVLRMGYLWFVALLWPHDNASFARWKRMWVNPSAAFGSDLYRQPMHEGQLELVTRSDRVLYSIQSWSCAFFAGALADVLLHQDGTSSYLPAAYSTNIQPARERYNLAPDEICARSDAVMYAPTMLQIKVAHFEIAKQAHDYNEEGGHREFLWSTDFAECAWMEELTPALVSALGRLRGLQHLNLFIGIGIELHGEANATPTHFEKAVPVLIRNEDLASTDYEIAFVKARIVEAFHQYFTSARANEMGLKHEARGSDLLEEGMYDVYVKRANVLMIADTLNSVGARAAHLKLSEYRHTVFLGLKKPLQEMRMLNALYNDTYMPVQTRRWYHPRYLRVMESCSRNYLEYSCAALTFLAIIWEAYGERAALKYANHARKIQYHGSWYMSLVLRRLHLRSLRETRQEGHSVQIRVAVSDSDADDFVLCQLYGTQRTAILQCVAVNHHLFLMTEEQTEFWRRDVFAPTLVLDGIERLDNEVEIVTTATWTRKPGDPVTPAARCQNRIARKHEQFIFYDIETTSNVG